MMNNLAKINNQDKLFTEFMQKFNLQLDNLAKNCSQMSSYTLYGKVLSAKGTNVIAYLPTAKVGDLCEISDLSDLTIKAEVVAINGQHAVLIPFANINQVSQNCFIYKKNTGFTVKLSNQLLGTIVNGLGEYQSNMDGSIDNLSYDSFRNIMGRAPDPLQRPIINQQLLTNITAIDMFIPCGWDKDLEYLPHQELVKPL